jgi:hypothetical protein
MAGAPVKVSVDEDGVLMAEKYCVVWPSSQM